MTTTSKRGYWKISMTFEKRGLGVFDMAFMRRSMYTKRRIFQSFHQTDIQYLPNHLHAASTSRFTWQNVHTDPFQNHMITPYICFTMMR